ncbi:hypothetical protein GCM10022225_43630 [Plantactinospora mayteni]|uniref:Uncharacterized protein n=1 Tax=Plantactinospora mayteni TaxID=566021 RepID=A0ABQ4ERX4_9ACTN|nr:hypothetical protein [Plantactinospora mayteni]GIG97427.1 hypothetical protein Pma05_40000 [Plantactinospora mayteni]
MLGQGPERALVLELVEGEDLRRRLRGIEPALDGLTALPGAAADQVTWGPRLGHRRRPPATAFRQKPT